MERIKILFVDDEPGILDQAKIFLKKEDERFEIVCSGSATEALNILDRNDFDVIVSDYQMPDIDGLELLEEIRNNRELEIPFVMFTGRGREEVAMKALNLGADRYMQKGGDPKSQYAVLAQAIEQEYKHHRTEVSLKKKNKLLTQIFERSEEGFYIRDLSGKLTFVNEAFAHIHGYSTDEIIGKDSRSFLTEGSKEQVEDLEIDDLVDRWRSVEIETKSGRKKTLHNAIFPLRDEDGEIQEIFGIVKDITKRVEAEERLKKNKERLDLALKGTEAGIWDWYVQTGEMVVNERWAEMVGYELEELEPIDVKTWEDLAHPEDLERSYGLLEKYFAGENEFYEFEGRMKHKDGSWVWVLDKGKVVEWDDEGDPVRMTGTHIDITEKKETEELANEMYSLRSAIRQINQLIVQEDDLSSLLQKTCKMLKDLRTYMDISIAIQREDDKIVPLAHCGDHERKLWGMEGKEDDEIPTCIQEVIESGRVNIIKDVEKECGDCEYCKHEKNHKSILVPMLKDGKVNGVLSACISFDKEITEEEIGLLEEVSGDLAFARDKMVAEKELERKRRLLEKTEEISRIGGWEYDVKNDEMYWTENLFKIHGFSRGNKKGHINRSLEYYPPEARKEVKRAFERAVEEGESYDLEVPFIDAEGKEMWVRTMGEPIIEDGDVVKVIGNLMDITERKKNEENLRENKERYKNLFYKTPLGTFHYDDKGVITDCNKKFVEIIGSSREVLIGLNMLKDLADEDLIEEVRKSLDDGEGYYEGDYTSVTAGKTTPVRVLFKGMENEDGDIYAGIGLVEDITERKKAEEALKESEERYRRLFETAQDGMLILDAETGKIEDANPYILDILGYSKEELVGKELWEIGTFKEIVENRGRFEKLVQEGYIRYEDLPLEKKDGGNVPVEFVSNTYDVGGEKVVQCNIREISQRKLAKDALEHLSRSISKVTGEELFESIVDELIQWFDVDGACIGRVQNDGKTVASLAMKLDGEWIDDYEYELDGTPCENVAEHGVCMYEEGVVESFPEDKELKDLGIEGYVGVPIRDADGKNMGVIWAVSRERIVDIPSNWKGLIKMIAARAAAEIKHIEQQEEIKELYDFSSKLQTCKTEEEIYELAISAVDKILNFDVSGFVVEENGKAVVKATTSDTPEEIKESVHIDKGVSGLSYRNKKPYLIKDIRTFDDIEPKSDRYLSGITVPLGDIGVFQAVSKEVGKFDETDMEIAQILILHVEEALKRIEMAEREQFLHTLLRHDIGNKIQVVLGYLQLLEEETELSKKAQGYLQKAKKSSSSSVDLLEKIDHLRKADMEEAKMIDLELKIKEAIYYLKHEAEESGFEIDVQCPSEISDVKGGHLLKEVFSNIIENSIKYSGGKLIKITCEESDEKVVCRIEDDGRGIPDKMKNKVLRKGYTSDKKKGTGLGLYLVRLLLKSYGGEIDVQDSELGGARFDIHLKKN